MFILKSVTLRNFRSVNDATFTPLAEGVTGLSGLNGVGKSSFLEGMLWALFDVRGDGISTKHLRRIGSDPSEECFVAVVFEHEGNEVEVIRELRGKNARVVVNVFLDGLEQTHTSVKVANEWIRTRLRIDPDGFKTAFVVRQKELDTLVRARPAERRATIERLSGIEKLSEALKRARERENEQKREVSSLPGSQENVDKAQSVVQAQEEELALIQDNLLLVSGEYTTSATTLSGLQKAAEIIDEASLVRTRLTSLTESLAAAQNRLDAEGKISLSVTEEEITKAQCNLDKLERSLQEARTAHSDTSAKKRELGNEHTRLQRELKNNNDAIENDRTQLIQIAKSEKELITLSDTLNSLEAEVSRLTSERSRLKSENESITNRVTKVKNIIATLEESADNAHCPTCNSALEDIAELAQDFRDEIEGLLLTEKQNKDTLVGLVTDENQTSTSLAKARSRARSLQAAVDNKPEIEKRIATQVLQHEERIARVKQIADEHKELEHTLEELVTTGKALAEQVQDSKNEISSLSKSYESSQRIHNLVAEKDVLRQQVENTQSELDALLAQAKATQPDIPLEDVKSRYRDASRAHEGIETALAELKSDHRVQEERLRSLEKEFKRENSLFERKRIALQNLSELAAVSDTLDEFRKDRIAQIAPELSETATALISSMTSGRFTEVILDADFTPSVINDDGEELFVSQLSGGEESIVALALRVAIGDLITGGVAGLLWLDEVLTAQDASRRSSLMNTLSHIAGRQIVLISHTPESTDSVDKIVNLVATEEGSFLADE